MFSLSSRLNVFRAGGTAPTVLLPAILPRMRRFGYLSRYFRFLYLHRRSNDLGYPLGIGHHVLLLLFPIESFFARACLPRLPTALDPRGVGRRLVGTVAYFHRGRLALDVDVFLNRLPVVQRALDEDTAPSLAPVLQHAPFRRQETRLVDHVLLVLPRADEGTFRS